VVSIPVAQSIRRTYRRYKFYRWGYKPGSLSGFLASKLEEHSKARREAAPVRVYMDGCFDMMHYGHANALRQARTCGDVLVVGLIPDEEIIKVKGPPVCNNEERMAMVSAVKWVDEVIPNTPYEITEEFMTELFEKHKIDFIVHGDDPCLLPDGSDAYAAAKRVGRFVTIKRTEGISTTDLVGRMLMCVRGDNTKNSNQQASQLKEFSTNPTAEMERTPSSTRVSQFLPTSRRFVQFSSGKQPFPGATIVYVDGAFDMFHSGHVKFLEKARELGDFLLVGIHTDEVVQENRGAHHPIQSLHERALSVLSCRFVDEVVMGAPWVITRDLLMSFNVSLVVEGTIKEEAPGALEEEDPYAVPKEMGIFKRISSPNDMTTTKIIHRIMENRAAYEARNAKKAKSEQNYYENQKAFMEEV